MEYIGLNEITIKNCYPRHLINTTFEVIQGSMLFTKLNLRNAYHLVWIKEDDELKITFNTPTGHYEYFVIPFGLTNTSAVFQALVNDILRDMIGLFVFVYLGDILIFPKDHSTHREHVRAVII